MLIAHDIYNKQNKTLVRIYEEELKSWLNTHKKLNNNKNINFKYQSELNYYSFLNFNFFKSILKYQLIKQKILIAAWCMLSWNIFEK